jgi:histone H3/H4
MTAQSGFPGSGPASNPVYWRKCTTCKKLIQFNQKYWVCSVSTCNRVRTGLVFCTVECFDAHVPVLNHRDAGAFEKRSPTEAQWRAEQVALVARPQSASSAPAVSEKLAAQASVPQSSAQETDSEILVVVSKVKEYIRSRSGMSTSDRVMEVLSRRIRAYANDAIRSAEQDGRKTVMDRDFYRYRGGPR